jgi:hypothetical protein
MSNSNSKNSRYINTVDKHHKIRWLLFFLFLICTLGPSMWSMVNSNKLSKNQQIFCFPKRSLDNYKYFPVHLEDAVSESLGTTNLLNGHFFDYESNRVSVFVATWLPGEGTIGNIFAHNPEVCWVAAGFQTQHLGEVDILQITNSGKTIPFQCRILKSPSMRYPEITIWAICIDGKWDELEFGSPPNMQTEIATVEDYVKAAFRSIKVRAIAVHRLLAQPTSMNCHKQIIRISKPLDSTWTDAINKLSLFLEEWLTVQVQDSRASTTQKWISKVGEG